jgi:type I restriction enzyme S subunit
MSLPAYPEYKTTQVEWLGKVPDDWFETRLKALLREVDERAEDEQLELLGLSKSLGVVRRSELEQGASVSDNYGKYKIARAGQLVMNKMQAWNGVFGIAPIDGMVSPDYAVYDFVRPEFGPFLCSMFRTDLMAGVFFCRCRGMGTAFLRLNTADFLDIRIALPPADDARRISEFLDQETAKIDALVAEQRRLIELLKEKRQAVISHAVTQGLELDRHMKPSGIDWLGEVPANWRVLRLKQLSPRISGRLVYQPAQYFADEGIPFLMGNNISDRGINWDSTKFIPHEINETFSHHALREGDVVTVRVGAPGVTCVVPKEADGLNCGSLMIIRRSSNFVSDWLAAVMNSPVVKTQIAAVQYGAAQEQINITDAVNFLIPTPPVEEQQAIVVALTASTGSIENLSLEAERAIDLLQERRTALISGAVTGQIDVRGLLPSRAA